MTATIRRFGARAQIGNVGSMTWPRRDARFCARAGPGWASASGYLETSVPLRWLAVRRFRAELVDLWTRRIPPCYRLFQYHRSAWTRRSVSLFQQARWQSGLSPFIRLSTAKINEFLLRAVVELETPAGSFTICMSGQRLKGNHLHGRRYGESVLRRSYSKDFHRLRPSSRTTGPRANR
jgi:hypothetical protein